MQYATDLTDGQWQRIEIGPRGIDAKSSTGFCI